MTWILYCATGLLSRVTKINFNTYLRHTKELIVTLSLKGSKMLMTFKKWKTSRQGILWVAWRAQICLNWQMIKEYTWIFKTKRKWAKPKMNGIRLTMWTSGLILEIDIHLNHLVVAKNSILQKVKTIYGNVLWTPISYSTENLWPLLSRN